MNITGLNGTRDINALKALLAQGLISEDDLNNATMSGSFGPQTVQGTTNALSDVVNPGPQDGSQQPTSNDLRSQGQTFVRNENTGQTIYMTPMGPSDIPMGKQLQGQVPQSPVTNQGGYTGSRIMDTSAPQGQMRVIGSGNGAVVDLGTQPMKPVALDSRRGQIDIPGVGRADYGADGNAYIRNGDGSLTKVLLGYDMQGSMALNKQNLENQKTAADIAATQEHIRASKVQNPDFMGTDGAGPAGGGATGDSLLQQLDPGTAALVKGYAEGRLSFPGGAAMRSPRMMQLLNLVAQYDPSFDAKDFNARNRARIGFSSGKQGDAVRAADQALQHAGALSDEITSLNNFNGLLTPLNSVVNPLEKMFGDPRQGRFEQNAVALASELRKVFATSGGGSLAELQNWEAGLPVNASQEQQRAYLAKGMDLLNGAVTALNDQYQRAMGPRANVGELLSPNAKASLAKLEGLNQPDQSQQPDQAQGAAPANSSIPRIGEVRRGYKYMGGDPSNPSSWRKA